MSYPEISDAEVRGLLSLREREKDRGGWLTRVCWRLALEAVYGQTKRRKVTKKIQVIIWVFVNVSYKFQYVFFYP